MNKYLLIPLLFSFIQAAYAQKGDKFISLDTESKFVSAIAFTPGGSALAAADNTVIKIFSAETFHLLKELKNGHIKQILTLDISGDSILLASGGKDSMIVIWDLSNGNIVKTLKLHEGIITSLKFSPDGGYLLSGSTDHTACLYDIEQNKVVYRFSEHKNDITSVAFSPDGKYAASAGADKIIYLRNTVTGEIVASLKVHKSWVRDICFSSDGQKLLSCGDDSRVITWDISKIENISILTDRKQGQGWLMCIDMNQDNNTYATGSFNGRSSITGQYLNYKSMLVSPVVDILFRPNTGINMTIAAATLGKGVFLIDASKMVEPFKK